MRGFHTLLPLPVFLLQALILLGVQAGVYELIRDDGSIDKVKVLKAKHKYALMTKMQREWEVGRRISSLKNPERAMPGYMSVGPAVCTENGNFKGKLYLPARDHASMHQHS